MRDEIHTLLRAGSDPKLVAAKGRLLGVSAPC